MIERDHEHLLRPVSKQDLPDGRLIVHSVCICTLEEQRITRGEVVTALKFRFGGLWFSPLDLLRINAHLGIIECADCGGTAGLTPCELCHDLGVSDDAGEPLGPRDLKTS